MIVRGVESEEIRRHDRRRQSGGRYRDNLGGRVLSFGNCPAFALKSLFAVAKYFEFGATLE